jgi:hypothetical protein
MAGSDPQALSPSPRPLPKGEGEWRSAGRRSQTAPAGGAPHHCRRSGSIPRRHDYNARHYSDEGRAAFANAGMARGKDVIYFPSPRKEHFAFQGALIVGLTPAGCAEVLSQLRFCRAVLTSRGAEDIFHTMSPLICVPIPSAGLCAS